MPYEHNLRQHIIMTARCHDCLISLLGWPSVVMVMLLRATMTMTDDDHGHGGGGRWHPNTQTNIDIK